LQTKSQVLISPLLGNWSRSRIEHFPHSEKTVSQDLASKCAFQGGYSEGLGAVTCDGGEGKQ
jgi:hypothetical protein